MRRRFCIKNRKETEGMIGWFLFSKHYWNDSLHIEILPGVKKEDCEDISEAEGEKAETVYIEVKSKWFMA